MYHQRALCVAVVLFASIFLQVAVGATFSSSDASKQLQFSYAAYCPSAQINSWNCPFCPSGFVLTNVIQDSGLSQLAYVGHSTVGNVKTVQAVYRGSTDITDWIVDLDVFTPQNYPGVSGAVVHGGFWAAYESVSAQVNSAVASLVHSFGPTNIYVTGHSLGAALATFSALDIQKTVSIPVFVYTYGSPRVGNQAFATYYNSKLPNTFRNTYKNDIVPHAPPQSLSPGFYHVAEEVHWTSSTANTICTTGEDSHCADGVLFLLYSASDHTDYLGVNLHGTPGC